MHELGITLEMIEAISERMSEEGPGRVRRVVVEIGKLSAVFPDAIRFSFELCAKGTLLEGSELEIIETSGQELKIKYLEIE
jgi:hydrogenase nickel incorporation protein HypA/HybF